MYDACPIPLMPSIHPILESVSRALDLDASLIIQDSNTVPSIVVICVVSVDAEYSII